MWTAVFGGTTVFAETTPSFSAPASFTQLAEMVGPAVVNIRVTQFGDRVTPDTGTADDSPDMDQMPEFFLELHNHPRREV